MSENNATVAADVVDAVEKVEASAKASWEATLLAARDKTIQELGLTDHAHREYANQVVAAFRLAGEKYSPQVSAMLLIRYYAQKLVILRAAGARDVEAAVGVINDLGRQLPAEVADAVAAI